MTLEQIIAQIKDAQNTADVLRNEAERDGNSGDVLFFIDQSAITAIGGTEVSAPTTILSPQAFISGLKSNLPLVIAAVVVIVAFALLQRK